MTSTSRLAALLLVLAPPSVAASAASDVVDRFDAAVARLSLTDNAFPEERLRPVRSAADFEVERRLNIEMDFPGDVSGTMYSGLLQGEAAVFTRWGTYLDATVMHNGHIEVTSFDKPTAATGRVDSVAAPGQTSLRRRRSVAPGHVEVPGAYSLHFYFLKHDDVVDRTAQDLHASYVAWWLADLSRRVLPVEPVRVSYVERMSGLTSVAYGDASSLDTFERALRLLDRRYDFGMDRSYKKKFVLLTAGLPMPGTTGVAYEGGNEAIASIAGRKRIVAHEIGHLLGATHEQAETSGWWWGCETNMFPTTSSTRSDCMEYSAANRRAMRSYMRHGPDLRSLRKMVD
jgi:hypothetical protein